ncbi:hypothetical protein P4B35_14015 [Pontiellaceae bacterium B12227]|nr:hypothetical protein [Pontiellaceae bacterium B12227]
MSADGMIGKMLDLIAEEVIRKITVFPQIWPGKMANLLDKLPRKLHIFLKRMGIIKYNLGFRTDRYDRADFERVLREERNHEE